MEGIPPSPSGPEPEPEVVESRIPTSVATDDEKPGAGELRAQIEESGAQELALQLEIDQARARTVALRGKLVAIEPEADVETGTAALDAPPVTLVPEASTGLNKCQTVVTTLLSLGSLYIMLGGIIAGHARLAGPPAVHIVLFACTLIVLGYLEGLQIALLEVLPEDLAKSNSKGAHMCARLTNSDEAMQKWLCGRQVMVILSVYLTAQLANFPTMDKFPGTEADIPDWFQSIVLNTGITGILVVVAIGQLVPQLVAGAHPLAFLSVPGLPPALVYAARVIEAVGYL
jgi:hypothetical protein